MDAAIRAELAPLKVSALAKRARALGVAEGSVDDALDSDQPRRALTELILPAERALRPAPAPAPAPAAGTAGAGGDEMSRLPTPARAVAPLAEAAAGGGTRLAIDLQGRRCPAHLAETHAMLCAAESGDLAAVAATVRSGRVRIEATLPSYCVAPNVHRLTALMVASHNGHAHAVEGLLKLRADVEARSSGSHIDTIHWTPLHHAAAGRSAAAAAALIAGGADRFAKTLGGDTPETLARRLWPEGATSSDPRVRVAAEQLREALQGRQVDDAAPAAAAAEPAADSSPVQQRAAVRERLAYSSFSVGVSPQPRGEEGGASRQPARALGAERQQPATLPRLPQAAASPPRRPSPSPQIWSAQAEIAGAEVQQEGRPSAADRARLSETTDVAASGPEAASGVRASAEQAGGAAVASPMDDGLRGGSKDGAATPELERNERLVRAAAAALPPGWEAHLSKSTGLPYYVNARTGESTYDRPNALGQDAVQDEQPLPAGWETAVSRSTGLEYYVNARTGESTYERPSNPAAGSQSDSAAGPAAGLDTPAADSAHLAALLHEVEVRADGTDSDEARIGSDTVKRWLQEQLVRPNPNRASARQLKLGLGAAQVARLGLSDDQAESVLRTMDMESLLSLPPEEVMPVLLEAVSAGLVLQERLDGGSSPALEGAELALHVVDSSATRARRQRPAETGDEGGSLANVREFEVSPTEVRMKQEAAAPALQAAESVYTNGSPRGVGEQEGEPPEHAGRSRQAQAPAWTADVAEEPEPASPSQLRLVPHDSADGSPATASWQLEPSPHGTTLELTNSHSVDQLPHAEALPDAGTEAEGVDAAAERAMAEAARMMASVSRDASVEASSAGGSPSPALSEAEPVPLPAGWETAVSRSTGLTYWINTATGESTYERPGASFEDAAERVRMLVASPSRPAHSPGGSGILKAEPSPVGGGRRRERRLSWRDQAS